jgi:two-component system response regulator RegX3
MQAIIVSQDADERDFAAYVLRRAGMAVAPGADLKQVAENWLENPVDLVVVTGLAFSQLQSEIPALRAVTEVPVIVLAEAPTEAETAGALSAGADLVLAKPVPPKVLAAYSQTVLRRTGGIPPFALPVLDVGEVVLNPSARTVKVGQREPQRLTQLEFRLLYILMTNRDQVIPSDVIVERVWGYTGTGSRELVRNLVSRLRSKLEPDPGKPRFIHTLSGLGYQFGHGEE